MKVGIVGATGYGGIELIRLLQHHPHAELSMIISSSQAGEHIEHLYPHLQGIIHQPLQSLQVDTIAEQVDIVFFATPSGVSQQWAPSLLEKGVSIIDLSGDFRLKDSEVYQHWYQKEAPPEAYVSEAVYGLSEVNGDAIGKARLVANPGCYPTASLLALVPLVESEWIDPQSIIIDGKTGVSGAGRGLSLPTHFAEANENVKAYKLGQHQHIPEIEQMLNDVYTSDSSLNNEGSHDAGDSPEAPHVKSEIPEGRSLKVSFSTHLTSMTRGILCTQYVDLVSFKQTEELLAYYEQYYAGHPFVRIRPQGQWPGTKEVYGSNYCDISLLADERTGRCIVVSVIDNIMKGAAGQAIQNMNIMNGLEQTAGLDMSPVYP